MPLIQNLPLNAESTADILINDQNKYLYEAFDALEGPLTTYLEETRPDWIIFDVLAHWLPPIAEKLGITSVVFNILSASLGVFVGPVSEMMSLDGGRSNPEGYMVPPKWVPFPSHLYLRRHEVPKSSGGYNSPPSRFAAAMKGCDFMIVRSCNEFEGEWLKLLVDKVCMKPVIPVGMLISNESSVDDDDDDDERWIKIKEWLDKQPERSVVYAAFGSESILSQNQVTELAHGFESSKLTFLWALRIKPSGFDSSKPSVILPTGFEDRVGNKGIVTSNWVPQNNILAHRSVGGFLTHGGSSSFVEGLGFGLPLILLPLAPPQALNARIAEGKKLGVEISRDENDGSFTGDSVAEALRLVMVDGEGETIRANAQAMKEIFGDKKRNERYIDLFDAYLKKYKSQA